MAARCLQDGPRCTQDGPRWSQDGPRRPKRLPRGLQDGPRCLQEVLQESPKGPKSLIFLRSLRDFGICASSAFRRPRRPQRSPQDRPRGLLEDLLEAFWAVLGHLETILGRLGCILGRLGNILRPSWVLLGPSWLSWKPSWPSWRPSWGRLAREDPRPGEFTGPYSVPAGRAEAPGGVLLEKNQNQRPQDQARQAPLWQANRGRRIYWPSAHPATVPGLWVRGFLDTCRGVFVCFLGQPLGGSFEAS